MTRQEIIDAIKEMLERCYYSYHAKDIKARLEVEDILRRLEAGEEIELAQKTVPVIWMCPLCHHKHECHWKVADKPHINDGIWMVCENCGKESHMSYTPDGWKPEAP